MAKHTGSSGREPMALALILCDHVHIDPITGRFTMLGTFDAIEAEIFPVIYPKIAVYAAVTDGRGSVPITIRLVDVDEEREPVWSATQDAEFANPREVQQLFWEGWDIEFPAPGVFRLQLLAWDATIVERTVFVNRFNEGDSHDD